MNGDSVADVFTGCTRTRLLFGEIFCFTFTFVSICVFQNLNLILVEDSYLTAKYAKNFDWLTGKSIEPRNKTPNYGGDPDTGELNPLPS